MLSTVALRAVPAASAASPLRDAAPRASWRLLAGRPALPGAGRLASLPGWAPPASQALAGRVVGVRLRARAAQLHTGAIALGATDRETLADDAEDAPHNRVAAEEYRAQLAREEEAGLFEGSDGDEDERVEVDANAQPDDTLAVRARAQRQPTCRLRIGTAGTPRRAAHALTHPLSPRPQLSNFDLTPETVKALAARNIAKLFPIQGATFKPLSEGRDLIGRARTGTGKTLAFSLPIVEKLIRVRAPRPAAAARTTALGVAAAALALPLYGCRRTRSPRAPPRRRGQPSLRPSAASHADLARALRACRRPRRPRRRVARRARAARRACLSWRPRASWRCRWSARSPPRRRR